MSDLVLAVEKALADRWRDEQLRNDSDPEVDAYVALQAIHDAGWRLVRTERAGYIRGDLRPEEITRLYHGSSPMDGDEWLYSITEEWTPEETS